MKLIVAGGRDFTDANLMIAELQKLVDSGEITDSPELVCGMAYGADLTAYSLWSGTGMVIHKFPADWARLGKRAGYKRNQEMGEFADAAVCFWDGKSKGTKHMIDIMNKLGKPVYVIRY